MSNRNTKTNSGSSHANLYDEPEKLLQKLSELSDELSNKHFNNGEFVMRVLEAFLVLGAVLYVMKQLTGLTFIILAALFWLAIYHFGRWSLIHSLTFFIKLLIRSSMIDNLLARRFVRALEHVLLKPTSLRIISIGLSIMYLAITFQVADAISTLAF